MTVARGAAFGDIDNDGDVDVVINDNGGPMRVLRNVARKVGGAAQLTVLEADGLPAIGARLDCKIGTTSRHYQVQRTYSYCATNDPRIVIGLGAEPEIREVEVTWLDGTKETFGPFPANRPGTLKRGLGQD